jgi:hypothetical protein
MQVVDRIVRLPDGRSMGYAQYGTRDGFPIVNAHGGLACRLGVAAADAFAAEALRESPKPPGIFATAVTSWRTCTPGRSSPR